MLRWLLSKRRAAAQGPDARALLAEAYAHHQAGRLAQAEAGYAAVLRADPQNYYAEQLLGMIALQHARLDAAAGHFERAVGVAPENAGAHNGLGETYRRLGRFEQALASLQRAVALDPRLFEGHYNLGGLFRSMGRNDDAIAAYRSAIAVNAEFAPAHAGLAAALRDAGDLDQALASAQRALALDPGPASAHLTAGNMLREKGFLDEAAAAYRAALEREPRLAEAHNNLGNVLRHRGRTDEALACYEEALRLKPDFAEALLNAAQLLRENRRLTEAVAAYGLLLQMRPDMAEAHLELGNALKGLADVEAARAHYRAALEREPGNAVARWALAMSQVPMIAQSDAEAVASRDAFAAELEALERWCAQQGAESAARAVGTQQPFYLAYQDWNSLVPMKKYGALCAQLMGDWQAAAGLQVPSRITRAELRVGIVSAHVCDHSVWHAITKGWVQHLDRGRIDVRLFHLGRTNDVETALAKTLVTHYAYGKSDFPDWARVILEHQADVLIYPEIGMDPVAARLASLRLAPVQAVSWGHPHTSGLPTIDYYLSADALEAPDADAHYSEKLVRLPGFGSPYAPAKLEPSPVDVTALGLRAGVPLLLCAGTPFKYTPRHDALLVDIARRLGDCQFVFFQPQPAAIMQRLRDRMWRAFGAAGLDAEAFVRFVPWQRRAAFYGLMQEADVYLDTIGFSGYNSALQAIECGLPIAAWEGQFLRGRLASGLLRRMGLDELVSGTEADYVRAVVRLAQDAAYWGEVRERMIAARERLYNDAEPVRALERFLEDVVRS